MRRAAAGETLAHLRYLQKQGVVDEIDGEPAIWRIVDLATRA
jgi:hypothetical protein